LFFREEKNRSQNMSIRVSPSIGRKKLEKNSDLGTIVASTRKYYNIISDNYVRFYHNWIKGRDLFSDEKIKKGYDRVADIVIDVVAPDEEIIDVGCGVGVWSVLLAQNGAYVTSVDFALNPLRKCNRRARAAHAESRVSTVLADGSSLPFREGIFDGALLNWVIEHVPVLQHTGFLREVSRVIREDGWLVLSDSRWRGQEGGKEQIQVRATDEGNCDIYKYYFEPKELQNLITEEIGVIDHFETTEYELICVARKRKCTYS
jgi:2-polyprenyl-3-methyl-5-hydroxy-6-metoxy-1,4-benzoquinol methylase